MKLLRNVVGVIFVLFACFCFAQVDAPQFEVPKITFDKWQTAEETEEFNAFTARFPSAFLSNYADNDMVQLHVQLPVDIDRPPMVLILHYWGVPTLKVERSLALELNQRGIGAAIMTLSPDEDAKGCRLGCDGDSIGSCET